MNTAQDRVQELFQSYGETVYRTALGLTGKEADAQDATQNVFLYILKKPQCLDGVHSVSSWLQKAALYSVRKVQRERRRKADRDLHGGLSRQITMGEEVEETKIDVETSVLLRQLVSELPDKEREPVVLHYFQGLDYRAIAEIVGCSASTVAARLKGAREALRVRLAPTEGRGAAVALGVLPFEELLAQVELRMPRHVAESIVQALRNPPALPIPNFMEPAVGAMGKTLVAAAVAVAVGIGLLVSNAISDGKRPEALAVAESQAGSLVLAQSQEVDPTAFAASGVAQETVSLESAGQTLADGRAGSKTVEENESQPRQLPEASKRRIPQERVARGFRVRRPRLTGKVLDAENLQAIPAAELTAAFWESEARHFDRATSDGAGSFEVVLPRDSYDFVALSVRAAGYRPFARKLERQSLEHPVELLMEPGESCSIRGRAVLKGSGEPVAGLALEGSLGVVHYPSGRIAGEILPPGDRLRGAAFFFDVRTDDDGRFFVAGLPASGVRLEVARGQSFAEMDFLVAAAADAQETVLEVEEAARIVVKVMNRNGKAEPYAAVSLERRDTNAIRTQGPERVNKTGQRAFDGLTAGTYKVRVGLPRGTDRKQRRESAKERARDFPDMVQEVTVVAGQTYEVVFQADADSEGYSLDCQVLYDDGTPAADVRLVLVQGQDVEMPATAELPTYDREMEGRADAAGWVHFEGLSAGTYELVGNSSSDTPPLATVSVPEQATVQLRIAKRYPVRGIVLGPGGEPVAGATVHLTHQRDGVRSEGKTDSQGRFSLDPLPEGRMFVWVLAQGYRTPLTFLWHRGDDHLIQLESGGTLRVRGSVRAATEIADGLEVEANIFWQTESESVSQGQSTTLLNGRFEVDFEGLPPAQAATLSVRIGEYVPVSFDVKTDQEIVELPEISLEEGYVLRGTVQDPEGFLAAGGFGNAYVRGRAGLNLVDSRLASDGRFELRGLLLEPLTLELSVKSPAPRDKRSFRAEVKVTEATLLAGGDLGVITLKADEESDREMAGNALKITVTDPQGLLARAGFQTGDLVVGLGGIEYDRAKDLMEALYDAGPRGGAVEFLVLRGTEKVRLEVDSAHFKVAEDFGGDWEPAWR